MMQIILQELDDNREKLVEKAKALCYQYTSIDIYNNTRKIVAIIMPYKIDLQ
jgi:hypothetical protein